MKKLFIICAILFILSCNNQTNINTETAAVNNSGTIETETTKETKINPPDIAAVDYGGKQIKFLVPKTDALNILFSEIGSEELNAEIVNDSVFNRNLKLEDKYNIRIESLEGGWDIIKRTVMADDKAIDAATPGVVTAFSSGIDGNLAKIQDLPYINYEKPWWRTNSITDLSINNINYFISGDMNILSYESTGVIFFDKTLINNYKLDDPYDLVLDFKWTFNKMIEMGTQVSADVNGDGVYGEEDLYGVAMNSYGSLTFTYGADVKFAPKNKDDIPYLDINERFITIFQNLIEACKNNVSVMYTEKFTVNNGRVRVPQTAFEDGRLLFYNEMLNRTGLFRSIDTDFGILPMPKYEEYQENYNVFVHQSNSTNICVLITSDYDQMGRVLEDMAYYSYLYVRPSYIDISLKTKYTRDERSVEMIDIIIDNTRYDIALVSNNPLLGDLRDMLSKFNENVASAFASKMDAYNIALQKTIDNYK
ncbi:MAG: hypothetical protein FWF15_02825 [Oscillospiraceae bacterium]|nr:hypothetical protein [Oscillospiraceae bacterium]